MMRKELLVSGGMASILTLVTGVVLYMNRGKDIDPTTNVPPPDMAADEPKTEPAVPGWPANTTGTPANASTAVVASGSPTSTGAGSAPANPFAATAQTPAKDTATPPSNPWSHPAAEESKSAAAEVAKDQPRPFGANEAADAASAFSNRFKTDVVAEKSAEKKEDPSTGGSELKFPGPPPLAQANSAPPATTSAAPAGGSAPGAPMTTPDSSSSALAENRNPIFGTPAPSSRLAGPASTTPTQPAPQSSSSGNLEPGVGSSGLTAVVPAGAAPAAIAATTPRIPTSEDLQWRPLDSSSAPPRMPEAPDNPLRAAATTPSTLPTLGPRDAPATKPAATQTIPSLSSQTPQQPVEAQPMARQPVQVASVTPVSTPPRVIPIPAGTRTQELGRVYTVEEGDSLSDIARRELGNPGRAGEIQALNREVLANVAFLRPGMELILPR